MLCVLAVQDFNLYDDIKMSQHRKVNDFNISITCIICFNNKIEIRNYNTICVCECAVCDKFLNLKI